MPIRIVQSKHNARLKELRRALANPGRADERLTGVEGPILLHEALHAGLRLHCVFVAQGSEPLLDTLGLPDNLDILSVPRELLDSAMATDTPQPVAALLEPPDWTWAHFQLDRKGSSPLILVLAGIQDPGNLGTVIRSAEAFGADGIISLPGTVSAWNPKAVRASAGSVFRLPLLTVSEDEMFENIRGAGVHVVATTVQGAQAPDQMNLADPVALIIGNEGNGIPMNLAAKADGAITIPCPGPVESLNAAVAASVLLYEAARQRSAKSGGPPELRGATR
jgi:RNA methyltransferase, TrmH family